MAGRRRGDQKVLIQSGNERRGRLSGRPLQERKGPRQIPQLPSGRQEGWQKGLQEVNQGAAAQEEDKAPFRDHRIGKRGAKRLGKDQWNQVYRRLNRNQVRTRGCAPQTPPLLERITQC